MSQQIFVFPFLAEDGGEPAAVARLCTSTEAQLHATLRITGYPPADPAGAVRLPWIWKFFEALESQGGTIEEPTCCHIQPAIE